MASPFSLEEKQVLLETKDLNLRKKKLEEILNTYILDNFSNPHSHLNKTSRSQDLLVPESQSKYVKVSLDVGKYNNDKQNNF